MGTLSPRVSRWLRGPNRLLRAIRYVARNRSLPRGLMSWLAPWPMARGLPKGSSVEVLSPARGERPVPRFGWSGGVGKNSAPPAFTVTVPERRAYRLGPTIVYPRHIIVDRRTREVVPIPYYQRHVPYPNMALRVGGYCPFQGADLRPPVYLDGPVLVSEQGFPNYGHFLLEAVARLAYYDKCPPGTRVATAVPMTRNYLAMFEAMGVRPEDVVQIVGPTFCEDTFYVDVPADAFGGFVSDVAWAAFARLGGLAARSSIPVHERIYVSRTRFKERRELLNEAEIEDLFARHGFFVLHPQEHPIEDQVRLFANARAVAGPRGSGLHNIVFSAPDTRLLLLTHREMIVKLDMALMREDDTLMCVLGERVSRTGTMHTSTWTIDPSMVDQAIKAHFGI